jgi:hypothetical protein
MVCDVFGELCLNWQVSICFVILLKRCDAPRVVPVVLDRQLRVDLGHYDQILLARFPSHGLCHVPHVHLPVRTRSLVLKERLALFLTEVCNDSGQKRLRLSVSTILV